MILERPFMADAFGPEGTRLGRPLRRLGDGPLAPRRLRLAKTAHRFGGGTRFATPLFISAFAFEPFLFGLFQGFKEFAHADPLCLRSKLDSLDEHREETE